MSTWQKQKVTISWKWKNSNKTFWTHSHRSLGSNPCFVQKGCKYYLHFVDDCIRFSCLFLLETKDQVTKIFLDFRAYVERQFDAKIKTLQSTYDTEFMPLSKQFHSLGIISRFSCSRTPKQNGWAERKSRHITEVDCNNPYFYKLILALKNILKIALKA